MFVINFRILNLISIIPKDSEDSWHPDCFDKALNDHAVYNAVGPVMLRHGISCAAMADLYKVFYDKIAVNNDPLTTVHRLPNEREIRNRLNTLRDQAIEELGQKQYEGTL